MENPSKSDISAIYWAYIFNHDWLFHFQTYLRSLGSKFWRSTVARPTLRAFSICNHREIWGHASSHKSPSFLLPKTKWILGATRFPGFVNGVGLYRRGQERSNVPSSYTSLSGSHVQQLCWGETRVGIEVLLCKVYQYVHPVAVWRVGTWSWVGAIGVKSVESFEGTMLPSSTADEVNSMIARTQD